MRKGVSWVVSVSTTSTLTGDLPVFSLVRGMSTGKDTAKFWVIILRDVGNGLHEVLRSNHFRYLQIKDPDKTAGMLGISAIFV